MSLHYTFILTIRLRSDLSSTEQAALAYLINGEGELPSSLPSHRYFSSDLPKKPIALGWEEMEQGSYASSVITSRGPEGELFDAYVRLYLPCWKLEGVYQEAFALAGWLASLCRTEGYMGCIVCEDEQQKMPTMLFSYGSELHCMDWSQDLSLESAVTGKLVNVYGGQSDR